MGYLVAVGCGGAADCGRIFDERAPKPHHGASWRKERDDWRSPPYSRRLIFPPDSEPSSRHGKSKPASTHTNRSIFIDTLRGSELAIHIVVLLVTTVADFSERAQAIRQIALAIDLRSNLERKGGGYA